MKTIMPSEIFFPLSRRSLSPRSLLFLFNSFLFARADAATWYVKPTGVGVVASAHSWGAAVGPTNLQAVINAAAAGDMVWVQGSLTGAIYYPQALPAGISGGTTTRDDAFTLANGVAVYGGFAGTETLVTQRNPSTYITILSGDIGVAGNNTDNCYHVVLSVGNNNTAILDGFTIELANANGAGSTNYGGQSIPQNNGGGLLCAASSPVINNCIFTNNTAAAGAGACITLGGAAPVISNCTFSSNTSTAITAGQYAGGGGMQIYNAAPAVSNCSFTNNSSASDGGGFLSVSTTGTATISSSTFNSNTAALNGGGLAYEQGGSMNISQTSFIKNSTSGAGASNGGGGVFNSASGLRLTNCSLSKNTSASYGGGALNTTGAAVHIYNTSFSQNSAATYGGGYANDGNSDSTLYCNFSQNTAVYGAGTYISTGSPYYMVDTFSSNTATSTSGLGGGGMLCDGSSNPIVSHCWFDANVTNGGDGAGQYVNTSATVLDSNCVFQANKAGGAASNGGGLYYNGGTRKVLNCVFVTNSCTGNGGGINNNQNNTTYENCTLYDNASGNSTTGGDGMYVGNSTSPHITNDIIWSPNASSVGLVIVSATPKITYSDIQGQTAAHWNSLASSNNNQATAPTFVGPSPYEGADGMWATADDGLHLNNTSAGANIVPLASSLVDDITTAARPIPGPLADMGAYEGPGTFVTLSVQWLNFSAASAGSNTIDLHWDADAVGQVTGYEVQRSADGTFFSSIGALTAVNARDSYEFTDGNATAGVNYYRLRMMETSGNELFSSVVGVRNSPEAGLLSIRPSLAQQSARTLYIRSLRPVSIHMTIVDASGRVWWNRPASIGQGDNYLPLDLRDLPAGIYYLHVGGEDGYNKIVSFGKL